MRGLMIQGTASDVGKSILVTALCRAFANQGYRIAPFKSQNMSNNLYTTSSGKIISKAQKDQAFAAKQEPVVWMNPIVLNMKARMKSEVIMLGEKYEIVSGKEYRNHYYDKGIAAIKKSLHHVNENYDIIMMEGAGSPVEINLKERELVNMKPAELADVPVLLVADIERGGVFASIIGTLTLLTEKERNRVAGIVINKFRGDRSMLDDGLRWLEGKTNLPILGVIPLVEHDIAPEDSLSEKMNPSGVVKFGHDPYDDLVQKIDPYLDMDKIKDIIERWYRS